MKRTIIITLVVESARVEALDRFEEIVEGCLDGGIVQDAIMGTFEMLEGETPSDSEVEIVESTSARAS